MRRCYCTVLFCAFATATASPQTIPLSSPAAPPSGFTFEGKWACDGHFANGKPHQSTYEGASVLGGSWIQLKEIDIQPAGYQAIYLIGYDKAKGQVIEFDANNFGSADYLSEGWKDKSLTLTSSPSVDPKALLNRFVFQIADATHFAVNWEINGKHGWQVSDHLDCTHGSPG